MKSRKKKEDSFEYGMEALNHLADQLEAGDLGLDESLQAFEEGVKLYRRLQEQLTSAKLRIETIAAETEPEQEPEEEAPGDEF
jgi:exodeoxyribonuclease VII small subunit